VNDDPTIYDTDRVLTGSRTMHRGLTRLVLAAILPAIVLCGCATIAPVNVRVDRVGPETGYRITRFVVRDRGPTNNPDALVLLAFSGGTRAAALYNPTNWLRLASDSYGRSELAADYYDEILFGGATFSDLIPLQTPVAVVTGTDLSTGARFEFSQDTFDLLCSDLGSARLARAAATSSAVPVLLSPVTYRNYGGKCDAMLPIWVQDVANREPAARPAGRALLR
jgi:hypothetical protein